MIEIIAPFRAFLKPLSRFYWDEMLQDLFEKAKEEIVSKIEGGGSRCFLMSMVKDGGRFLHATEILQVH